VCICPLIVCAVVDVADVVEVALLTKRSEKREEKNPMNRHSSSD
jgi:hypothetical protein